MKINRINMVCVTLASDIASCYHFDILAVLAAASGYVGPSRAYS